MKKLSSLLLAGILLLTVLIVPLIASNALAEKLDKNNNFNECPVNEAANPVYDGNLYGFAYNGIDGSSFGIVGFDPEAPVLSLIDTQDFRLCGGEYYDGLIYCYGVELIDNFYEWPHYYVIDPTDWTIRQEATVNFCYDMAYDYTSNTMYGIVAANRALCTVDLATGEFQMIDYLSPSDGGEPANLACDNAGILYTVSSNGTLYTVDKSTAVCTAVGNTGYSFTGGYFEEQSMYYDHMRNALYAAQYDGTKSTLLKIDTSTGSVLSSYPLKLNGSPVRITTLFAFYDSDTPVPPTDTPVPPTDTPVPPTDAPDIPSTGAFSAIGFGIAFIVSAGIVLLNRKNK